MMFVIWSPWWYGLWVSAYSVHIAQAEKLKEASEKRFRFSPIYFGVYSSKNRESKRQHCRVSASARSQLMVFISSSLRLSLIFFWYRFFSSCLLFRIHLLRCGFFPACDFQFNRRASLWWRWLWCGQVTQRPTYLHYVWRNQDQKVSLAERRISVRADVIRSEIPSNGHLHKTGKKCMRPTYAWAQRTPHRERRLVWSYWRCHCPCKLDLQMKSEANAMPWNKNK